ncbi:Hypothetical predicted protein [Paramuricea clavata]|uniref:Uncharacterized protein n=1 Tax=Paramuricea clavata TaxID=317549 RepID=A0A7D9HGU8_PARCT|nr:Hypothetical predicted protein [Paramuricea clavata]
MENKTEGKEQEVNDKIGNNMPPSSGGVTEESGSHKRRKKAKKQKHESDLAIGKMEEKTEGKEKEVNTDVSGKIGNDMPPSSGDITVESDSHNKRKKAKKQKHESDFATEKIEEKMEGKETEVNTDVKDKIGPSICDVTDESGSHKKRKKAKKQKHESDFATEKNEEKNEGKETEVNTDVKDKIGPSICDVTDESGSHKKRKKAKKQKHESDFATEKNEEKNEGKETEVNTDVKDKIGPSICDVTDESGSHKKRKKAKKQKHESDSATEKIEGKETEVNTDGKHKIGPSICDVNDESGSHKKRKKAKKQKHESDFATEKNEEKNEGKETEVNTDVSGKIGNDMPPSSGDITVESDSHKKKKKAKKQKHESDLSTETTEEKTEGKEEEVNTDVKDKIGSSICDVTDESGSYKKRKKAKKQKHESDSATEKIEEKTEGKEKEVNTDVSGKIGNVMHPSSGDITVESDSHKKKKKAKKQKHESDLSTEKTEEKTEGKEEEVNTDVKDKIGPSICDVTDESGSHKKRKKAKKQKHESDSATEKIEEKTEGKEKEVNTDVSGKIGNDMHPSSGDITVESDSHKKKKKAKKQKHESDLSIEKMEEKIEGKEKEVNSEVKGKIGNDMPAGSGDVTEESDSHKKRKKTKQKHEGDLATTKVKQKTEGKEKEVNTNVSGKIGNNMPPSNGDITVESDGHKKKKKAKKQKHESDLSTEKTAEKTEGKEEEVNTNVKDKIGPSICDVTDESGSHKKREKTKKQKHERDLAIEKMEEKREGKEKEVNSEVKGKIGNDLPAGSGDVTEESDSHKKGKKTKKQKHEGDLATTKVEEKTEGKEKEVNTDVSGKIGSDMPPSSGDITVETDSHKKKAKKQKHESDLVTEKTEEKTEGKEEEVNTDVKDKIVPSICDVTDESGGHKKRKKAKKQKHESDLATENIEEEIEGKEKEVNIEVKGKICNDMPPSSGDVTVESDSHKKKKKAKKQKHESDFATEKTEEKTEGKEEEVNTDVKDKIVPSICDVTDESGGHKKRKKAKKQKHESDLATENIEEEIEGKEKEVNIEVKGKICNDMPPSSGDVTVESDSHKKKKKAKKQKHESDFATEKTEEKTEGKEEEVNTDVKDKIVPSICDVTDESGGHKKRKKAKKQKHESDLATENIEEEIEGKEKEVNIEVKGKICNDMPPSSGDVTVESDSHKKKKKAKKQKHESDFATEKTEEKTEGKEEEVNTDVKDKIVPSICDVTDESGSHKKRKKAKKQKHETEFGTEKIEEKIEGKEKELNTVVKDKIGNNMPPSSSDVTEESGIHEKMEKAKKRKHESDLVTDGKEKTEGKETEVNTDVKDKIGPSSCDVTDESGSHKKRKKAKKQKHESDFATEKIEEKIDGKEKELNTDVKDKIGNNMPQSSGRITEESGIYEKMKKAKKRKHETGIVTEEMDEKTEGIEKEIGSDVKDKVGNDMSPSSCDVTEELGSNGMKKAKKEKHETDLMEEQIEGKEKEVNADVKNTICNYISPTICDAFDKSGSQKKGGKSEKEEHESAKSLDVVGQKSDCEEKDAKADVKGGLKKNTPTTNNLVLVDSTRENTVTSDVDEELEKEETAKTLEGISERSELDEKKKIDDKTGNQWESAEFASVEKKEKFLRLMGAFKPSTEQRETSNYSAMAMNKEQEKAFASSLEKQYFQAMQSGKGKGVGLGYE